MEKAQMMKKTTWGNSLMQVGFVWQNEGQDRTEYHHWDVASLKSSLIKSGEREGKGKSDLDQWQVRRAGEAEIMLRGPRERGSRISICDRCDGAKRRGGIV